MKQFKKYLIGASALLIILVGCGVAVGRTLNGIDDQMLDDTPKSIGQILSEIRSLMQDHSIAAYIVPSVDAHNSEYISLHDRRLQYVTSFTGSEGTAIITLNEAAIWVDSRYHLQAENQLDQNYWTLMKEGLPDVPTRDQWLLDNLPAGAQVATDPFLITSTEFDRLARVLVAGDLRLTTLERNLVDIVWNNRPPQTSEPLIPLDIQFSGKRALEKVADLRKSLETNKADAILINGLDEIAWLVNLRGSDIRFNPVFFAYVIVSRSQITLFTNPDRFNETIKEHFRSEGISVTVRDYGNIISGIQELVDGGEKLMIASSCSQAIYAQIPADKRIQQYALVATMKAVKNAVEAEGMRKAHIRDGAAVVRYLHWLEENVDSGNVTELSGAAKLNEFRSMQENFVGLSFTTISAFGPNGAIIHYSPTEDTDKLITRDNIYLIDSGGQYYDGTTDITRSLHMGEPTAFQKEAFTRVLQGFLSLGSAVFPTKTSGTFFEAMARRALWDVGLDYGHDTGHGIGSFLGVHEYPPSIEWNSASPINQGLQENMFTSNEPGYYEADQFGIRLEDIVQVVKADVAHDFGGRGALTFYTNTVVPLQTKLMDVSLMSKRDVELVNRYHERVQREVGALLLEQKANDAALNGTDDYMFDDTPKTVDQILSEIRSLMQDYSIAAYIVPSVDAHASEYVSLHDRRFQYVTNFTGSAGTAIITLNEAAIWVDSRYHLQAENQLDLDYWTLMKEGLTGVPTKDQWLLDHLAAGAQVATDPFLITSTEFDRLGKVMVAGGLRLTTLERNLVDIVWNNRPTQTSGPLIPLDIEFSGKRSSEKIVDLRKSLETNKAAAIVINGLDEIAWLLNLRGSDIRYNPVFFAYVIVSRSQITLFTNPDRINETIREHFRTEGISVTVRDYGDIVSGIEKLVDDGGKLMIASSCSQAIYAQIPADKRIQQYALVATMKAVKNSVEAEGMRKAHIRDGAAVVRYLHWLEENVDSGNVTELSGAAKLREFRSVQENFVDLSFTAISAFGSNGAIVHYSPTEDTDTLITRDNIYLIDSGGQYFDGTTDITRSVHMGEPTAFQKEAFTRVLQGFLSLGSAVFPTKTSGTFFDAMARRALWDVGLDYGHGTGHGIGSFLGVHEYPPSIVSSSSSPSNQGLQENMFTSNEPGYYEADQFGIRLEDIVQVVKANVTHDFGGRGALTFYTNTVVPLQTKLMDVSLMSQREVDLVNRYHERVQREVGALLLEQQANEAYVWLGKQTQPVVKS